MTLISKDRILKTIMAVAKKEVVAFQALETVEGHTLSQNAITGRYDVSKGGEFLFSSIVVDEAHNWGKEKGLLFRTKAETEKVAAEIAAHAMTGQ